MNGRNPNCGKPDAPPRGGWAVDPDRAARSSLCRAKSSRAIKLCVRSLRQGRRIPTIFCLRLIQQRAEGRPWTRVVDYPSPCRIAVQFGQKSGQIRDEFFAFGTRQALDGGFDFLRRAHGRRLRRRRHAGKLASDRLSTARLETDGETLHTSRITEGLAVLRHSTPLIFRRLP